MYRLFFLTGSFLILASCSSAPNPVIVSGDRSPAVAPTASPAVSRSAIPKGAQYTLFCASLEARNNPLHVEQANQMRNDLIARTKMPDWYVVHQEDRSSIYYGYYRAVAGTDDPQEVARAQADRQKIAHLQDSMGNQPFTRALFVELAAPDPVGRPEWNLLNAQGRYTIQIGVYKGSPQRKEAAVEAVAAARAQGIEAYYLHGQTSSMVCVGVWPENALIKVDPSDPSANSDPNKPLVVIPETGDSALDKSLDTSARQNDMQLVRPTVKIVDPTLLAMMQKFPYTSVNGSYIMHQSKDGKQIYDPSWVIPIPKRDDPNLDRSEQIAAPPAQPGTFDPNYRPVIPRQTDTTPPPSQQPPTNTGRLRSITGN